MKIEIRDVRLAFPKLFVPEFRNQEGTGKKMFSVTSLFPTPDYPCLILPTDEEKAAGPCKPTESMLSLVIEQVAKAKWGSTAMATLKSLRLANLALIYTGDTKASTLGYAGNHFINAASETRPTVVNQKRVTLGAEDGKPYGGCYANVILDVWAQDNKNGKRINASLSGVQYMRDGDAFTGGGRVADANDFANYEDGADAEDLA